MYAGKMLFVHSSCHKNEEGAQVLSTQHTSARISSNPSLTDERNVIGAGGTTGMTTEEHVQERRTMQAEVTSSKKSARISFVEVPAEHSGEACPTPVGASEYKVDLSTRSRPLEATSPREDRDTQELRASG